MKEIARSGICIFYIFNDQFRQLRNLEKVFGGDVRVCDRTALILDIFNQRAATREAALQVNLYWYLYFCNKYHFACFDAQWDNLSGFIGSNGIPVATAHKNVDAS